MSYLVVKITANIVTEHCCQVCVLSMIICRSDCRLCADMVGNCAIRKLEYHMADFTPTGRHGKWYEKYFLHSILTFTLTEKRCYNDSLSLIAIEKIIPCWPICWQSLRESISMQFNGRGWGGPLWPPTVPRLAVRSSKSNLRARFHERSDPPDRGDPEWSWVTLGRNSVPQTILTPRINDPEWSWLTLPLGRDHSGSLWLNMAANWFLCWYLPRQVARWPFSERHRLILSKLGQSTMVTLNLVRILCSFI